MQSSSLASDQKIAWLIRFTCLFWIVAKLMSWKLWLADRLFPLVPPFDFLQLPSVIQSTCFGFSIVVLILLLLFPNKKYLQITIVAIEIVTCALDQNRWQPWEYQYLFTILIVLINWRNEKNIISLVGFLLASIYFYSGLGKINPVFLQSIWYNLLLSKTFGVSYELAHHPFVYYSGYLLGIIEVVLGIGLLFKKTYKATAILLLIMHLMILGIFGPVGLNYDHVIWPWNLAMISLLVTLVLKNKDFNISFSSLKLRRNILITLLFGLMPFFSLFGYWDFFLSSSLFSSRPTDMYICVPKNGNQSLSKYYSTTKSPCDSSSSMVNLRTWAFDEMTAPAYPQARVYNAIKLQLQNKYPDLNATYFIYTYQNGKKIKEELK